MTGVYLGSDYLLHDGCHMWSRNYLPVGSGVRLARSLVFCAMFCVSLFVLLTFFSWPLCCLSIFSIRLLINPLVSSSLSYSYIYYSVFDCRERGIPMPHENIEEFKKDVVVYEPSSLNAVLHCFSIFMPVIA